MLVINITTNAPTNISTQVPLTQRCNLGKAKNANKQMILGPIAPILANSKPSSNGIAASKPPIQAPTLGMSVHKKSFNRLITQVKNKQMYILI